MGDKPRGRALVLGRLRLVVARMVARNPLNGRQRSSAVQRKARIWLYKAPHNRKRPSGEEGRFWGYYREERYVSLYMWIRGR